MTNMRAIRCRNCNLPTGGFMDVDVINRVTDDQDLCQACTNLPTVDHRGRRLAGAPGAENAQRIEDDDEPREDEGWCCGDPRPTARDTATLYYNADIDDIGHVTVATGTQEIDESGDTIVECANCGHEWGYDEWAWR